jgi:hypothetical protein
VCWHFQCGGSGVSCVCGRGAKRRMRHNVLLRRIVSRRTTPHTNGVWSSLARKYVMYLCLTYIILTCCACSVEYSTPLCVVLAALSWHRCPWRSCALFFPAPPPEPQWEIRRETRIVFKTLGCNKNKLIIFTSQSVCSPASHIYLFLLLVHNSSSCK